MNKIITSIATATILVGSGSGLYLTNKTATPQDVLPPFPQEAQVTTIGSSLSIQPFYKSSPTVSKLTEFDDFLNNSNTGILITNNYVGPGFLISVGDVQDTNLRVLQVSDDTISWKEYGGGNFPVIFTSSNLTMFIHPTNTKMFFRLKLLQ